MNQPERLSVESYSIDFVPASQRYGTPLRLFTIWFSINLSIVCAAVGTIASGYGLSPGWCIAGLAIGNAIGSVFMAAHSAQGPHLGVPQMIQSRAQFGVLGAALPLVAVVITYLLYTAADGLLVEGALRALLPISNTTALVSFGAITLIIAYVGYEMIHRLGVFVMVLSGLLFAAAAFVMYARGASPEFAQGRALARFSGSALMLTITQSAAWSLSFGPYVADYSRYLPRSVRAAKTFWYTGLGCFLGATSIMAFGVYLGFMAPLLIADPGTAIAQTFGSGRGLVRSLIIIGVLEGNVMNLYSAYMSTATIFSGLQRMQRIGQMTKLMVMSVLIAIATAVSIIAQDDFQTYFGDILSAMIYVLVPWSAINLADYYLVRRGHYVIADLFRSAGQYGAFRWRTIADYAFGILVQVPFMSLSFFKGFVAERIGADLAWLPGLLIPAALYVLTARDRSSTRQQTSA
jgi:nucleobase:cation symporter-1, NCS1 family